MTKNFQFITALILFTTLLFFSCGQMSPQEKELDALQRTVMSIHDDVMPEISTIRKLQKQIKKSDQATTEQAKNMINRLEKEDDAMMDWMKEYNKPNYKQYDAAKKYLLEEKIKIEKVREGMLTVIEDAKNYIEK